jgi:hypothetical protein
MGQTTDDGLTTKCERRMDQHAVEISTTSRARVESGNPFAECPVDAAAPTLQFSLRSVLVVMTVAALLLALTAPALQSISLEGWLEFGIWVGFFSGGALGGAALFAALLPLRFRFLTRSGGAAIWTGYGSRLMPGTAYHRFGTKLWSFAYAVPFVCVLLIAGNHQRGVFYTLLLTAYGVVMGVTCVAWLLDRTDRRVIIYPRGVYASGAYQSWSKVEQLTSAEGTGEMRMRLDRYAASNPIPRGAWVTVQVPVEVRDRVWRRWTRFHPKCAAVVVQPELE